MQSFQIGYVLEELIFNGEKPRLEFIDSKMPVIREYCTFDLHGLTYQTDVKLDTSSKIIAAIASNYITRGNPTRCSLKISEKLLGKFRYEKVEDINTGSISFYNNIIFSDTYSIDTLQKEKSDSLWGDLVLKPIIIAQLQFIFLQLIIQGKADLKETIKISINQKIEEVCKIAITDLQDILKNIAILFDEENIELKVRIVKNADYKIGFSLLGDEPENFNIYLTHFSYDQRIKEEKFVDKVHQNDNSTFVSQGHKINTSENKYEFKFVNPIFTKLGIKFHSIGQMVNGSQFQTDKKKLTALKYFLKNGFRKLDFREGQLAIINRALQGLDVIGILPTGGGKSLTYQICSLLNLGISIVIDPIKSLMFDQFDKLKLNFINRAIYINSADELDDRKAKEQILSEGKINIAIIGPERFQMVEFRDYLDLTIKNGFKFGYTIIDEAHCISEWGHDFRFSYLRMSQNILRICFGNKKEDFRQIALTATASFDVLADIKRELDMPNDAQLPIPEINRDELHFEIIEIPNINEAKIKEIVDINRNKPHADYIIDNSFVFREKAFAKLKYPILKKVLKYDITTKIAQGDEVNDPEFKWYNPNFDSLSNQYPNAGIIFCNTKSDALGNGVYAISNNMLYQKTGVIELNGLSTESDYLEIGTYMGDADENSWLNQKVNELAAKSLDFQNDFMANKLNLMVATKAFGMGIDKSNIRFTIHYTIPQSVESFYQEAGRAGRDRRKSVNIVLYNKKDVENNLDLIRNAHKGKKREINILKELLDEIKYEDEFMLKLVQNELKRNFSIVQSVKLYPNRNETNYSLKIYHKREENGPNLIGTLFLGNGSIMRKYTDNLSANITEENSNLILDKLIEILRGKVLDGNIVSYLKMKTAPGIETILNTLNEGERYELMIGFNNNTIGELGNCIKKSLDLIHDNDQEIQLIGQENEAHSEFIDVNRIIRAAYNFCDGKNNAELENRFIANLSYQYFRVVKPTEFNSHDDFLSVIVIDEVIFQKYFGATINFYKEKFWHIRNNLDTQKAIYRLSIISLIDDYTVDYRDELIKVSFTKKKKEQHLESLKKYLLRYEGEDKVNSRLLNLDKRETTTEIRKYLYEIVSFFEETITKKRLAAARHIDYLIGDVYLNKGDNAFRQEIEYYFKSKYARPEFFQKDFIENNEIKLDFFKKYINYIFNPPDELGKELDNVQHLLGACNRYLSNTPKEHQNRIVQLLNTFCKIVVESTVSRKIDKLSNREKRICDDVISTFKILSHDNSIHELKEFLSFFSISLFAINAKCRRLTDKIQNTLDIELFQSSLNYNSSTY